MSFYIEVRAAVNDNEPPTAIISSPADNGQVSGIISVLGTVNDETQLASYALKAVSQDGEIALASGTSPIINAMLALWDTTTVKDGIYRLELNAADTAGSSTVFNVNIYVNNTITPAIEFKLIINGGVKYADVNTVIQIETAYDDGQFVHSFTSKEVLR